MRMCVWCNVGHHGGVSLSAENDAPPAVTQKMHVGFHAPQKHVFHIQPGSSLTQTLLQILPGGRGWGHRAAGRRGSGGHERRREEAGGAEHGLPLPGHLQRAAAGGGRAQQQLPQGTGVRPEVND